MRFKKKYKKHTKQNIQVLTIFVGASSDSSAAIIFRQIKETSPEKH